MNNCIMQEIMGKRYRMFGGSQSQVTQTQESPLYPQAQSNINNMLNGTAGNTQNYTQATGQPLNAPWNSLLTQGYQSAQNYANQPLYTSDPLYKQGTQALSTVMSPSYLTTMNPLTQYNQQYAINTAAPEAYAQTAGQLGRTGPMSSSAAQNALGQVGTNLGEYLQGQTAQQLTQNQATQLATAPTAAQWAQNTQNAPAQQSQMLQSLGSGYQNLAQSDLNNLYSEWQRQMNAQTSLSTQMQGQYPQYQYSVTPGTNSAFSQYVAPALSVVGDIAGSAVGDPLMGNQLAGIGNLFTQNYGNTSGATQGTNALSSLLGVGSGSNNTSLWNALFGNSGNSALQNSVSADYGVGEDAASDMSIFADM